MLLQKKAPRWYSFDRPDYADITVGGHYQAGETIPDGVREVHEELGLPSLTATCTRSACGRPPSPSPPTTSNASSNTGT
ncbi:hypothetical protein ACQPXB_22030 [Amycolatopsis sp. CA-161197]|uniref:hypothetical protein n=1 Tax=Amycolatopsis sp. CA-161197 TaxID=3239922 RepID=UPI003D904C04